MTDNETNPIEGKTIIDIRPMSSEEKHREGWSHYEGAIPVLELSDGQILYPSTDPEGNGPGALFGYYDETDTPFFINP